LQVAYKYHAGADVPIWLSTRPGMSGENTSHSGPFFAANLCVFEDGTRQPPNSRVRILEGEAPVCSAVAGLAAAESAAGIYSLGWRLSVDAGRPRANGTKKLKQPQTAIIEAGWISSVV